MQGATSNHRFPCSSVFQTRQRACDRDSWKTRGPYGRYDDTGDSGIPSVRSARGIADLICTAVDDLMMQGTDPESAKPDTYMATVAIEPQHENVLAVGEISAVGLLEFLDIDDRPVFILDLKSLTKSYPVYCNPSLQKIPILELKIGKILADGNHPRDPAHTAFLEWAVSSQKEGSLLDRVYRGLRWSAKTIGMRWRVISGDTTGQDTEFTNLRRQSEIPRVARAQTAGPERARTVPRPIISSVGSLEPHLAAFQLHRDELIQSLPAVSARENPYSEEVPRSNQTLGKYDFTNPSPDMVLSPHLRFVLEFDWASTELGPMSKWDADLRRMTNFLMNDPRPAAMYWGKSRTMLYNEPYVVVTGQRHPRMMGKKFEDAWEEVADYFIPLFDQAYETGASYNRDDARFYIERHGYIEETYYSISIIPFTVSDGGVAFYNPVFDVTRQIIADRRMGFLLQLGQHIASSREPKYFWQQLLIGLEANEFDTPFAILYSAGGDVMETLSESSEQSQNLKNWVLEGSKRVPDADTIIPQRLTNETATEDFISNFGELIKAESPTLLLAKDGTLPDFLSDIPVLDDLRCESAVFLPIRSTGDTVLGFLLLGVNPRKRYDNDYRIFMELLSRQLATSMASAVLFEEELRRGRMMAEQANQDKNILSRKLEIQRHEAMEIEHRFRRMADLAPVGMFHISAKDGVLLYANNDYYRLTGHQRDVSYPMSWYDVIAEADHPLMDREWAKLLGGEAVSFELRLKQPFIAEKELIIGEKVEGPMWIIAAAYPDTDDEGNVVGILGCLTDISRQKWMEDFQTRKMLEAVELKRQQENFIDMTSHEMRNPLSAIIQCADWIGTSLAEYDRENKNVTVPREMTDAYTDAAQTIVLCAQHQKRIIDDILTLSKLDSDLLLITPVEVRPVTVIQNALKMFDSELHKSDMEMRFHVDHSYTDLNIDWVKLDPSRLLQVLINLTTNAIKFTQTEAKRKISISISASINQPIVRNGIEYLPRSTSRDDMSLGSAWGSGEIVYLVIEVEDTGRGLEEEERNLLFKRFHQASPRTHVQYGGSGLGLFISRELTELQGGQIGVSSKAGVGSTFAFYIRSRRCAPPENDHSPQLHPANVHAKTKTISPAALAQIRESTPTTVAKASPIIVPKHVLIVEDNIVNQKVLSKQLRSVGCIVSVANHGEEALAFLATSRFWKGQEQDGIELAIVLMDLEMPVMDGLTCVKRIRELQREGIIVKHLPVIAVTANVRSEQIAVAKECGMDSIVTKPFRIPELLPEMERQVKKGNERPVEIGRSNSAPA